MDWADPQRLWLLVAAPAVVLIVAFCWRRRLAATAAWAARGLWDRLLPTFGRRRLWWSAGLLGLSLAAVALALAGPRWGQTEQQVERRGVDVVFVLDTSLSMAATDVVPNRLFVAQSLIRSMGRQLPGHRVALVQAEGDGVVMVPLTADTAVVDLLLDAVLPGSLPTPGTDLLPALQRAYGLFPEGEDKHKVMVVVSDGEHHGRGLKDLVEELADEGVTVHSIGVGTLEGKPLEVPDYEGTGETQYKKDQDDRVVVTRLQESNLEMLARETGGIYLRSEGAGTDLGALLQRIDSMDAQSFGNETVNVLEERFQWPLSIAILALTLHLAVAPFRTPSRGVSQ
ncbi:MAG: VWA domain-containing protein [Thermoanaerobaculia bacterium]|nr:VWA domain-containing protein [Thermoanaerobaculia bacterium]